MWKSVFGIVASLSCASCSKRAAVQPAPVQVSKVDAGIPADSILNAPFYLRKTKCEVHGDSMLEAVVPIEYGYVDHDPAYLRDYKQLFPNAVRVFGGGDVGPEKETYARVKYCPACRTAKQKWMAAHPGIRELGDREPAVE